MNEKMTIWTLEHTKPLWRYLLPLKCWWSPRAVYIEPTNACNLKCTMCPQSTSKQQRGFMELGLFKKIVDELPKASHVHLYYRGEALLHPRITDMAAYIKERGNKLTIATNGTQSLEGLTADRLVFSFDAPDKETFESIRYGAKYDEVLRNIRHAVVSDTFRKVVVEIVDMPQTRQLGSFIEQMHTLGVNDVYIKKFLHWNAPCRDNNTSTMPCLLPWHTLGIFWDGAITPCCIDYEGTLVTGNVRDVAITDAWNNEKIVALRHRLRTREYGCADAKTLLRPYEVAR